MPFGRKQKSEDRSDETSPAPDAVAVESEADTGVTQAHLQIINRILTATRGPYEVPEMLDLLVKEILDVVGARWGTIKLSTEESDVAHTMIRRPGIQAGTVPRVIENTAFFLVMGTGETLVVNDLAADSRFPTAGGESDGASSLLAVPVQFQGKPMGVLTLVDRQDGGAFSSGDQGLASFLAGEAGPIIKNAQLMEEAFQQRALEHERELAETVWRRFLPEKLPRIEGFDMAAKCVPARRVGGDYYDVIELDDGSLLIALADISGSGMPAALLMSNLQAVLRATARSHREPELITSLVNQHICSTTSPDRFATLFLGILDPTTCELHYVNAGHNPPFLFKPDGEWEELPATGIPVGFVADTEYELAERTLDSGTRLLIFSDGITEAFSADEEMFGEERLIEMVRSSEETSSQGLLKAILTTIDEWSKDSTAYQDDCTLLVLNSVGSG